MSSPRPANDPSVMGVLLLIASYVLGSVPTGLVLVRWLRGVDVRQYGSGAVNAANVYRVAGPYVGAAVLLADLLKGALPVLLAQRLELRPEWAVGAGIAALVGHNWSVFLRLQGGRGTVTTLGVLLALSPGAALLAAAVWLATLAVTRLMSLASVLAILSIPFAMWALRAPGASVAFGVVVAFLGLHRHRADLRALLRGSEGTATGRAWTDPRR